ncbi:MAG: TIGR00725 family protein [Nocardioidaceae bacterium]
MAYVAVCGPAEPEEPAVLDDARAAGRLLAERGHVVLTGGLGGVMAAAASGAASAGGTTVGLLPGSARDAASPGLTVVLPTGLGEMRNALLVRAADVVLAIGCSWGTLSEVALATRTGVPVVTVACWDLPVAAARTDCASVDEAIAVIDVLLP